MNNLTMRLCPDGAICIFLQRVKELKRKERGFLQRGRRKRGFGTKLDVRSYTLNDG